jgi:multicopper oxidase
MDVIPAIGPAQFVTADMTPDMAGTWMFHCHVDDHMKGGMQTMYRVLDNAVTKSALATDPADGHPPH